MPNSPSTFDSEKKLKLLKYKLAEIIDSKNLPIIPAYVLFGLILVSLGPFKILPKTYPPISVDIQVMSISMKNL